MEVRAGQFWSKLEISFVTNTECEVTHTHMFAKI